MIIKKIFSNLKLFYIFLIILLFIIFILSRGCIYGKDQLSYGVTYSVKQARSLGLDPQKAYLEIFDDLKVKKIRLSAYWDEVETQSGVFAWDDLDWQIDEAQKRGVQIILAVGSRLPRWPECHIPEWAKNLDKEEREKNVLRYILETVKRYESFSAIVNWQVENEPFLPNFGECPKLDAKFLDKEIALVKSIDSRPIVLTDSGELSLWVPAAKRADIFGTTMYRDTYSATLKSYIHYPIEPGFFRFKKNISRFFANPKKWIVIELQAEPWGPKPFQELSQDDRDKTMDYQKFKEILEFSRQAGFNEFYLWGVEWWYWEKTVKNNDIYWEEAKKLF
jgi:hypothetical protein